jgi:outer membrane lipoprotein-sorting protein
MKSFRIFIFSSVVIFFSLTGGLSQNKALDVIKMLQKKYTTIHDFSAELRQIQTFKFSDKPDTIKMTISLLKEDYFKIETSQMMLVTDGKIVKDYAIQEQQITIDDFSRTPNSFLPKDFLFEFPKKYTPVDFKRENRGKKTGYTIVMEPKKPDEEIMQTLQVWIDAADSLVKYVHYTDFNNNSYIYFFNNYTVDNGFTAKDFELKIPAGVTPKIVDLRKKKE